MISLIVLSVMAGMLAFTIVAVTVAILRNMRQGARIRRELSERLDGLRLRRALALFGIEPAHYLHGERIIDIGRQMRACSECRHGDQCETCLAAGGPREAFRFCPNYQVLSTL